jgi:hypothetical protein
MGFYITGSSFRTRPPLSPHSASPPPFWARSCTLSHGYDPYTMTHADVTFCIQRTGAPRTARTTGPLARGRSSLISVLGRSPTPDGPTACLTPTHQTRQRISRHSPSPTSHDASTSRDLSPFLSTRAPTDAITSRAWSSRRILRSFGLTAPRAHPETIGLLNRGVRSPVIYAPRNTS